jgi:small nuclear ribonucleoprotein (snRNP)-like protein
MNLVIDDAEEVAYEKKSGKEESRRKLGGCIAHVSFASLLIQRAGQILLKGDNISLIQQVQQ